MTPDAEFNFDYTSTSLGVRWYRFERKGGICGAAAYSSLPLKKPEIQVAERSRGHFVKRRYW